MKNNYDISARSSKNGIIFYSNIYSFIGMKAYFDEFENIRTEIVYKDNEDVVDYTSILNRKGSIFNIKNLAIIDLFLIISAVIGCAYTGNFGLVLGAIFFSVFVSWDLWRTIIVSYVMKKKDNRGYSIAKFHAAEHKVLNAYKKLKRIPTIEETKKFSRFSTQCGSIVRTFRIVMFFLFSILMTCILHYNNMIYLFCVLFVLELMVLAVKHGWLNFLQVFFTSIPTDKEIKLAVEGLRQFEMMEWHLNLVKNQKFM